MNDQAKQGNVADSVATLVKRHVKPQLIKVEGQAGHIPTELLVVPAGLEVHSVKKHLDEYLDRPERRKGTAKLYDLASFVAHAKRFASPESVLFADNNMKSPSLMSVLDYHKAGYEGDPQFGQHRGHYAFPLSDEWKAWMEKNREPMSQQDFAEFLENRISDVLAHTGELNEKLQQFADLLGGTFASPSKLVELSRGLAINEGTKVHQAVNLGSGEATVQYVSEHQDGAGNKLVVPNLFMIAIPVFVAGPIYQMAVRLRYRVRNGGITWFYELYREDKVFEHAFEEACDHAETETSLPLFVGAPEA
jgi:uncharacterized protein YfdQ (DUF2303 family)